MTVRFRVVEGAGLGSRLAGSMPAQHTGRKRNEPPSEASRGSGLCAEPTVEHCRVVINPKPRNLPHAPSASQWGSRTRSPRIGQINVTVERTPPGHAEGIGEASMSADRPAMPSVPNALTAETRLKELWHHSTSAGRRSRSRTYARSRPDQKDNLLFLTGCGPTPGREATFIGRVGAESLDVAQHGRRTSPRSAQRPGRRAPSTPRDRFDR